MTPEERCLLALIRAGINADIPADYMPAAAPDWQTIYSLAAAQGVLAVAWDGLLNIERSDSPAFESRPDKTFKLKWVYNVEKIEQQYGGQQRAAQHLAKDLAEENIPMMVLKGLSLSRLYPIPKHRPCGDIDIWLYGKQRQADELLRTKYGIKIDEDKHHHTVFFVDGVMVENHFDFLNVHAHTSNREIEHILQRLAAQPGETIEIGGCRIFMPPADFNALFLLRHAAAHFAAVDIGLRHLLDWALFVQRYHDKIDWAQLKRIARAQNMHRFLHCMNALAIDALGISPDCFPPFERDAALEQRVLNDILYPEFDEQPPHGNIIRGLIFKFRRWWANRWKHRIVYRENLLQTFFVQLYSHLLKPKSLK